MIQNSNTNHNINLGNLSIELRNLLKKKSFFIKIIL